MEKSESIKEIAGALGKFQSAVAKVVKDAANPFFKSKYASLENVLDTIKDPLRDNGLSFVQLPDGDGLTTIIMHTSGEWISAQASMELKGHTPQDQGSGITYMRRYALSAALALATEDDDDGNATSRAVPTDAPKAAPTARPVPPKKVADSQATKRKLIAELLAKEALVTPTTKEEFEQLSEAHTGLKLEPANYDKIIERLTA